MPIVKLSLEQKVNADLNSDLLPWTLIDYILRTARTLVNAVLLVSIHHIDCLPSLSWIVTAATSGDTVTSSAWSAPSRVKVALNISESSGILSFTMDTL